MPTSEQVERAITEMRKLFANYEYFFEHNSSPDWLQPLWDKGFFSDPPKPKDENGYRSFPLWPESQYLVRMASKAPDLVGAILRKLPPTENIYVHADVVQAAIALPGPIAAELSVPERKWIQSQGRVLWLLPDRYADLIAALAEKGQQEPAFKLSRALLAVLPDPRFAETSAEELKILRPHPIGRMDQWDYEQAIKKMRPALQKADPDRTLTLFVDLLHDAMRLGEPPSEEEPERDHSYIWRSAIEDHSQNEPGSEIRDVLIEAVRDVAEEIIRDDPNKLAAIVEELDQRKRFIFTRLSLHLLALFGGDAPDLLKQRLGDWSLLDEVGVRHEYDRLAQAHFKNLDPADQEKLLANLKNPPDMENFKRNFAAMTGRPATDDDVERAKLGWELQKLAVFRGVLPEAWRARYDELKAKLGEPKHPDFPTYHESGWVGPASPKSSADMGAMPPEELIAYLKDWLAPKGDPFGDSYEGLGRQLAAAVAADPERFAEFAQQFQALDPTYVRSVLGGFENALRENKAFPWTRVLELVEYVTGQPIEAEEASEGAALAERDPGWRWARGTVADLLEEGFGRQDEATIPVNLRERAWRALRTVTDDPDPTPAHEERYGGSNMDPLTLSLNTTRGKAMQALTRYLLWVRRDDEKNHPERVERGFDAIPEAREVLEEHLDPAKDPSLAVRAVYGQWFPWFVLIDRTWSEAHAEAVFPPQVKELRDAAWEAFLTNQPYDATFAVLERQYRLAVEELPKAPEKSDRRHFVDSGERLAEHLMILYARGKLKWDDENSLLMRFFEIAPERIRLAALEHIGRALYNGGAPLSQAHTDRLRELWRRRFEAFTASPDTHREELGAFGWWFASKHGAFPDEWLIEQLLRVLESGTAIDAVHLVIERLADLAPSRPGQAIHAFRLMLPVQKEPGLIYGWHEQVRRLISGALTSDDPAAREEAERTLNELAARGNRQFDDLIRDL